MNEDDYRHVRYIAKSYAKKTETLTEDDLFQVGCIQFLERIDRWDPEKGKKWDYMWIVVAAGIASYIRTHESLIYLPEHVQRGKIKYNFEDIEDFEIMGEDNTTRAEDFCRDEVIKKCLSILTEKQKSIVCDLYGLTDGRAKTLEEVANKWGVTRERIRQIAARSLRLMRYEVRNENIDELY